MTAPARPPAPLLAGKIGRYELRHKLGEGGLGVVYAAYDPELDREVAIKLLRPEEDAAGFAADERLLREARAIARLNHPNVVEVFDLGSFERGDATADLPARGLFIVMQLLVGRTLDQWLKDATAWEDVLSVFLQAGAGVEAAHRAGVVHRDFKPANVFVCDDGSVKVLDFGLAKVTLDGEVDRLRVTLNGLPDVDESMDSLDVGGTYEGIVIGTPAYMAPEQHMGDVSDPRCDQFAFCASLYRALFGVRPFAGRTPAKLASAKLDGRIVPPPGPTDVPSWVEDAVRRGLAAVPHDRWGSMGELMAALQRRRSRSPAKRIVSASVVVGAVGFGIPIDAPEAPTTCAELAQRVIERSSARAAATLAERTLGQNVEDVTAAVDAFSQRWADRCREDGC